MDEKAREPANGKPQSWPFVLFFRQGLFCKADITRKKPVCDELNGTNCDEAEKQKMDRKGKIMEKKMRKGKEKKRKKERRKRGLSLPEGAVS